MPEFILDSAGTVGSLQIGDLDAFTAGYIEALFFTSSAPMVDEEEFLTADHQAAMDEGAADGSIPDYIGFDRLAPASLAVIIADCAEFQVDAAEPLAAAYTGDYSPDQAGRDFWFTRNRHGVGFLDRDLGDTGERLSELARACGEQNVFFGNQHIRPDNLVHVDGERDASDLPAPIMAPLPSSFEGIGSHWSHRGAPMGRGDAGASDRVERIGLDLDGYDSGGAYWGIGEPLWRAGEHYFRAPDSVAAARHAGNLS